MLRPSTEDELAASLPVVLILRIVLDRRARLRYGELLDARANSQGRFVTVAELSKTVQRWLDRQREDAEGGA
jgi:hypothetical protein